MARQPGVFVRPLSMEEGRKLQRLSRTAKDLVRMRRAIVVMMSGQGQAVRDITSLLQVSADYVRGVIHAFNERGFDALDPGTSDNTTSSTPDSRRYRLRTICGSKLPARSRGTSISPRPLCSVSTSWLKCHCVCCRHQHQPGRASHSPGARSSPRSTRSRAPPLVRCLSSPSGPVNDRPAPWPHGPARPSPVAQPTARQPSSSPRHPASPTSTPTHPAEQRSARQARSRTAR